MPNATCRSPIEQDNVSVFVRESFHLLSRNKNRVVEPPRSAHSATSKAEREAYVYTVAATQMAERELTVIRTRRRRERES